jgi:hypothetical protein
MSCCGVVSGFFVNHLGGRWSAANAGLPPAVDFDRRLEEQVRQGGERGDAVPERHARPHVEQGTPTCRRARMLTVNSVRPACHSFSTVIKGGRFQEPIHPQATGLS